MTLTFNSPDKHLGGVSYGGYSESIVVDQRFVLRSVKSEPRRSRAPSLRRNHNLLAHAPPGRHQVVWFSPGEKHWHGAAPTTAMTHIAIQEKLDGKVVDWMEQVAGEQRRLG
jgi:hypothetical protein